MSNIPIIISMVSFPGSYLISMETFMELPLVRKNCLLVPILIISSVSGLRETDADRNDIINKRVIYKNRTSGNS